MLPKLLPNPLVELTLVPLAPLATPGPPGIVTFEESAGREDLLATGGFESPPKVGLGDGFSGDGTGPSELGAGDFCRPGRGTGALLEVLCVAGGSLCCR